MPVTYYTEAEYLALERANNLLKAKNKSLESMRPIWAHGQSPDSVAAQLYSSALQQIWDKLTVTNQTDAMAVLNRIVF